MTDRHPTEPSQAAAGTPRPTAPGNVSTSTADSAQPPDISLERVTTGYACEGNACRVVERRVPVAPKRAPWRPAVDRKRTGGDAA